LFEVPEAESASLAASVGVERADGATRSANDLFRRSFVANGLLHRTLSASGPVGGMTDGGFSSFAHTWTENFWLLVYRMLYRAMVMKMCKRHLKAACTGSWIVSKVVPTK
jgi:hypothetical protein